MSFIWIIFIVPTNGNWRILRDTNELWIDAQGELAYVSPSVQLVTGYTAEEILAQPDLIHQMVHPEDQEIWNAHHKRHMYQKAAADRQDADGLEYRLVAGADELEYRIVTREGEVRWLHHRCLPVFDHQSNYAGRRTSSRDITQRHRDQETLQEQEERLRLFIEAAPIAVVVSRLGGEIVLVNQRAEQLFGYQRSELIGQPIETLVPERFRTAHREHRTDYAAMPDDRRKEGRELLARQKDGSEFYADIHLSYIQTPDGPMVVSHLVDVTSRRQAQETLWKALAHEQELSELKSRFVSLTSHGFRNPLAAILATSETLAHYWQRMTPEQIGERLDRVRHQVSYMVNLLEDVQQMNRIQSGDLVFAPVPGHLETIGQQALEEIRRESAAQADRVHFQTEADLPPSLVDPNLLRQVFKHLIANGLKYSPEDKTVTVQLFQQPEGLTFRVRDQGIGIPPEDQKRLFEPFHRARNVGVISGTGLGLSIIQRIVDLHGGQIAFQSELDQGTTFTVTLPVRSPAADSAP